MTVNYDCEGITWCIRPEGTDQLVIHENFWGDVYKIADGISGTVLDIGGNIGAFSIAAIHYGANVVHAFEPEPENAAIFRENVRRCGLEDRIFLNELAVWTDDGGVNLNPDQGNTAVEGDGSVHVRSLSLNSILLSYSSGDIDFLKMDIEGAEIPVIEACDSPWLFFVKRLGMEYHGQTPEWGDMIRKLSGVFNLEIIGHEFPAENSGGMLHGVRK